MWLWGNGLAGPWLQEFTDLRDRLNTNRVKMDDIKEINDELDVRIAGIGRDHPIPKVSERALARMQREAALAGRSCSSFLRLSLASCLSTGGQLSIALRFATACTSCRALFSLHCSYQLTWCHIRLFEAKTLQNSLNETTHPVSLLALLNLRCGLQGQLLNRSEKMMPCSEYQLGSWMGLHSLTKMFSNNKHNLPVDVPGLCVAAAGHRVA